MPSAHTLGLGAVPSTHLQCCSTEACSGSKKLLSTSFMSKILSTLGEKRPKQEGLRSGGEGEGAGGRAEGEQRGGGRGGRRFLAAPHLRKSTL